MASTKYLTSPPATDKMPAGIPYIVGNEAAERFSFYGMKAILTVFMTQHLLSSAGTTDFMSDEEAKVWVHTFNFWVYALPLVGAIVSDWLFGKYHTIMALSIVYCAGHAVLAFIDIPIGVEPRDVLFWGLVLIAIGAGGIKPCVSAHVGDQFGIRNQHLLPKVFGWFYFSINLGSFASTLLTPFLLDRFGPAWAFGIPGALMAIATIAFWRGRHVFVHIPAGGRRFFGEVFTREGLLSVVNLVPLYLFISMFWSLFDQTASAWVIQADKMDRMVLGVEVNAAQMQAANPFLVMILIPLFSYVIYPAMGRYFEVSPLRKIGIGLFVTIPAFAIPAWIEMGIEAGRTPHIIWQFMAYVVMTAAEIMVSITALEFSYTQAPKKMKSVIMGLYLWSVAAGNKFVAFVNEQIMESEQAKSWLDGSNYYWFFTAAIGVTAVLYVIFSQFYRGQTYSQGEDVATSPENCPACGENLGQLTAEESCPVCGHTLVSHVVQDDRE